MTIDTSADAVEREAEHIERYGTTLSPPSKTAALLRALVAERDTAYARGFREGAETMRERAKAPVLRRANVIRAYSYSKHDRWPAESLEALAEEISALSLPEPQA